MSENLKSKIKSATKLSSVDSVEGEDHVYAVVRSEDGRILAGEGTNQTLFFNLTSDSNFEKKGVVFEPKSHRLGRDGGKDYLTVENFLCEFDVGLLDEISKQSGIESEDVDQEEQSSVDPFSTKEVDQNVGESSTISMTSTDSDMLSDLDVHKF